MDHGGFDALTRSMAGVGETRRTMLRLLAGGALGPLTARLGLAEDAAAKQEKRKRQAERKSRGTLQAEGKRKGKKGQGKKNKPKPKPPVPDPPCPDGKGLCPDGKTCVYVDECCPGEKRCNGEGECIPFYLCCPGEKECGEIDCIPEDECCELDPLPLCTGECDEVVCEAGEWVCRRRCDCGPDATVCRPGFVHDPVTCACVCPAGSMNCGYFCCPDGATCLPGEGFRNWCFSDGATECPIGWTPYRDSGLCYPGIPPA